MLLKVSSVVIMQEFIIPTPCFQNLSFFGADM
jgi:hypothetical protein